MWSPRGSPRGPRARGCAINACARRGPDSRGKGASATTAGGAAQPGWFLALFTNSGGTEGVRCEQIIAWEVQRTTSSNGLVTRFPIPITAESKNADLDCTIWGIKRPDGKFFFPAGANEGISKEKLSKFALLMETESLGEKLAFQGRSNGDVGHRLQTPEVVLAPQ